MKYPGEAPPLHESFSRTNVLAELQRLESRDGLLDVADRVPVVELVSLILFEAGTGRASDMHMQPCANRLVVRRSIDGVVV